MDKNEEFNIMVDDIWLSRWGCEQTNVEFYQVIRVTPKTVTLRMLHHFCDYNPAQMTGHNMPMRGQFYEEEKAIRRRLVACDHSPFGVYVKGVFGNSIIAPWNGEPAESSHYA